MPLNPPRDGKPFEFHVYPRVSSEGTLGNPESIIWASIRHLCSRYVAEGMAAYVHGITAKRDRESVGRNLKLYIRQASEFYDAAHVAKPNTGPLIYYYCFLNLAKALCELRRPKFHERPECYRHGISWRPNPRRLVDPERDVVSITTRGVWHELWEAIVRSRCTAANPTRLRMRHLFSYCPEISSEFRQATNDWIRLLDMKEPKIMVDQSSMECWARFSVRRDELKGFRLSMPIVRAQVRNANNDYIEVKSEDKKLRMLESVPARRFSRRQSALAVLETDILGLNAFCHLEKNKRLQYFLPVQRQLPIRMPQLLVSYTILFWLGSLVRYDPHSVAALMDSQWWMLMDGFITQSRLWLLELFEWAFYQAETTLWLAR